MQKRPELLFVICCVATLVVLCTLAASNNFTGDTGDSIMHYLYARYAWVHPALFLNHWAKPLFVLVASPFAQCGFTGIKLFNCLLAVLSCYVTYKVAQLLHMKNAMVVLPFMFFCPFYFAMVFSGLTEYLFGFLLITAIYLTLTQRLTWALLIVSFLPFVRAEGMIVMCVFAFYLLAVQRYKYMAVLLAGHVVYSIAGCFYYHDILWVFTKLPYANMHSNYGHGGPFDFVHILMYVIEKPVFILMGLGFIAFLYRHLRKGDLALSKEESVLVYDGFAVFFIAHSIFWWKGLFSSGGFLMPRVMNAEVPLIAIIALGGLNFILGFIKKPVISRIVIVAAVALVVVFPFTNRAKGLVFNKSLFVLPEAEIINNEVVPYIKQYYPNYAKRKIYYANQYLGMALGIDPFDTAKHGTLHTLFADKVPANTLVVWDDWFAPTEEGMKLEQLAADKDYVFGASFERQDGNRVIKFVVYQKLH